MFRRLRKFYRSHIAADVPIEMDLCLDCGALECSETQFAECPRRKARAAELAAVIVKDNSEREQESKEGADPPTHVKSLRAERWTDIVLGEKLLRCR